MRNILGRDLDGLPGFRISAIARQAIMKVEDAESADFDALPAHEAVAHDVKNRLHDNLCIFYDQMRVAFRESLDQLGLRHCGFSLQEKALI